MSNQVTRADIYTALAKKCGFQVVQDHETGKQLRIIGRCAPSRWPFMLPVIHALLTGAEDATARWTCDISKQYVIRNRKVLYGWRIIFQGDALAEQYVQIAAIINSAQRPSRVEVDFAPLAGYAPGQMRGGVNAKGKGSSSAGSIPLAMQRGGGGVVR